MDTQRIEQLFTLIANKSKSQDNCDNNRKLVKEILDNQSAIAPLSLNASVRSSIIYSLLNVCRTS